MNKKVKSLLVLVFIFVIGSCFYACESKGITTDNSTTKTVKTQLKETTETTIESTESTKKETTEDSSPIVQFGSYEQDGNSDNGKEVIEWVELTEKDNMVLLVSLYILDEQDYHDTVQADVSTWENCSLRRWLNEDFYNNAFDPNQKNKIKKTTIKGFDAEKGITTEDNVFLLSVEQVNKYLKGTEYYYTEMTPYAQSVNDWGTGSWWLIDSYNGDSYKYAVPSSEKDSWFGKEHDIPFAPRLNETEGVRPAIWIDKTAL